MSLIKLGPFGGEIPRLPQDLLPDHAAHTALDCDFSAGHARGIQAPVTLKSLPSTVQSIFTDDGTNYYLWDQVTEVCKHPKKGDLKKRICYTTGNGADTRFVSTIDAPPTVNGVTPTGYRLGVPAPDAPLGGARIVRPLFARALNYAAFSGGSPILTASPQPVVGWLQLADGMTFEVRFFYESGGKRYQEMTLPIKLYTGGEVDFRAQPSPTTKYANQTLTSDPANWAYVYGRSFHCVVPLRGPSSKTTVTTETATGTVPYSKNTVVTGTTTVTTEIIPNDGDVGYTTHVTTEAVGTPEDAKAVIHITAKIGQQVQWSVYSEGSVSASVGNVTLNAKFLSNGVSSTSFEVIPKFAIEATHAYVYTYVNIYGDESAPSAPVTIDLDAYQTVELYGDFTQLYNYAPIKSCRTYGTGAQAAGNVDYFFVSEGDIYPSVLSPGVSTAFSGPQPLKPQDWDVPLETIGWDCPPAGLTGLVALPNGMLAAFRDTRGAVTSGSAPGENEIWFCEPYQPHAWPAKYSITLPYDVVAIAVHGGSLVVVTTGHPYIINGVHPAVMSETKLSAVQAGVGRGAKNKQTICDIGDMGVVYLSNDGLVLVNGLTASTEKSQQLFTRQKWREFYGANFIPNVAAIEFMKLAHHDGYLLGYFPDRQGFIIRLDEAGGTFTRSSVTAAGHLNSTALDSLLLVGGSSLKRFASADTRMPFIWESKYFAQDQPKNYGAYQIVVRGSGAVRVLIGADSNVAEPSQTIAFSIPSGFTDRSYTYNGRLKAGFLARKVWAYFDMPGSIEVEKFFLATTMKELQRG